MRLTRREALLGSLAAAAGPVAAGEKDRRYLYVAEPGIRNYVEYGGVGVLVFDIEKDHRFVRRFPTFPEKPGEAPENVKGVCANAQTRRLYVSTIRRLLCLDLLTDMPLWEKQYEGGCDRMALSPDGQMLYVPSLEGPHWHAVDADTGDVVQKVVTNSGAHNTVYGPDGRAVYLAGLKSPYLYVADPLTHTTPTRIGPFSAAIRPFTVNGKQTLCYCNVNDLLGFEIGSLRHGRMLHRVEIEGVKRGPVKRHGCPSHGIGLTPDEREIWVADGANSMVHVFDATKMPPKQTHSFKLRDQPGWVTFSIDGKYAYPSTGEVFEVKSKKIVAKLTDEAGRMVQSEKMLEIQFRGKQPRRNGDQFGIGGKR